MYLRKIDATSVLEAEVNSHHALCCGGGGWGDMITPCRRARVEERWQPVQ